MFLGFVVRDAGGWQAQTIFAYTIGRFTTQAAAKAHVRNQGRTFLKGTWHYYDRDDHQWYPCVIKEAFEHRVTVIRTNEMGYQHPDTYKMVVLKDPDETILIKS